MSTSSNGLRYAECSSAVPGKRSSTSTSPSSKTLPSSGSASTNVPCGLRATAYRTSGCTATAVLDTSVHGVVVHTRKSAPCSAAGPEVAGKRTYTDGSTTVS